MTDRMYLPTFAELIDRLSILQLKEVFISENKKHYASEIKDVMHDLDLLCEDDTVYGDPGSGGIQLNADLLRSIIVLAQMNLHIWHNESEARKGSPENNNLWLTHGLNGIRNEAKNKLSDAVGERKDFKTDCLADEFKDWAISW